MLCSQDTGRSSGILLQNHNVTKLTGTSSKDLYQMMYRYVPIDWLTASSRDMYQMTASSKDMYQMTAGSIDMYQMTASSKDMYQMTGGHKFIGTVSGCRFSSSSRYSVWVQV